MLTPKLIAKRIKAFYPHGVDLSYVDYRDNFDENHKLMEELASTGSISSLDTTFVGDNEYGTIEELQKLIFTANELAEIDNDNNETLNQALTDTFLEIDTADPITEMLRHTSRRFFYYDLNFELENYDGFQDVEKQARAIAKHLRLSYQKHKANLHELAANAGYGGQLVILFTTEPRHLFGDKEGYIVFKRGYHLCIMDRCNGSGMDVGMTVPLAFQFVRENLHDDRGSAGYSYSYDVCGLGMYDEADFSFMAKLPKSQPAIMVNENAEAKAFTEREARYEADYKAGKCTLGDMKYGRHRQTHYINDFPCGSKCDDCGTFWID